MSPDKKQWTKVDLARLIQIYKTMPELWNQNAEDYKEKQLKVAGFAHIAKIFDTSIDEIRRKVHNMRCQFSSEIRKIKYKANKYKKPVSEMKSDWKYFNSLKFLLVNYKDFPLDDNESLNASDFGESAKTSIEYVTKDPQSDDDDSDACKSSTSQNSLLVPKSEHLYLAGEEDYAPPKKKKTSNDDHRIFGEYVASELRNMSERNAKKLKLKISKAILEVTEEEYDLENGIEYFEFS